MGYPATVIPEKIFFKIGEVCDLVGVQAHVLRYWETEFPMLSPQKNRSGQRTNRRRDVEIALRIKELLYDELFTSAGAKKKLQIELREATKLKIVPPVEAEKPEIFVNPPQSPPKIEEEVFNDKPHAEVDKSDEVEIPAISAAPENVIMNSERREALKSLASQLLELSELLRSSKIEDEKFKLRKY